MMEMVRTVLDQIRSCWANWCPAISAIVVAIQMIAKYCKKLKYRRKIVLITNARGSMDADDSSEITKKIVGDGIELVVVYVYNPSLML